MCYVFTLNTSCLTAVNRRTTGYLYSRVGNPTVVRLGFRSARGFFAHGTLNDQSVFEDRMAMLEGGVAAVAASSGQSAITLTITAIAHTGDNIVTA